MSGPRPVLAPSNEPVHEYVTSLRPITWREPKSSYDVGTDRYRGVCHVALAEEGFNIPGTVLFGTDSFWEGVDVAGESLSVLVITRLPFNVPTDPIFVARSELFGNPFNEYAVPKAILKFKQGFGRLIRTRSDRGVVVILDSRVHTKSYGAAFLSSLPRCTVKAGPARRVAEEAAAWLGRG